MLETFSGKPSPVFLPAGVRGGLDMAVRSADMHFQDRQRLAIQLAAHARRQPGEEAEMAGDHVLGQRLAQGDLRSSKDGGLASSAGTTKADDLLLGPSPWTRQAA